jgi:uncharacterized protein (DUF2141 family)
VKRLAALLALSATSAQAATVTVTVHGVRDDRGQIVVGVCTRAEFLHDHCDHGTRLPARAGTVTAQVPDVPPGTYAIQAYHDADGNGRLERSFFGLPLEGVGLSHDPRPRFGPPGFQECAVGVTDTPAAIEITLRYR